MEQVQTLLTMREQLVREAGAKRNALHVLRRKVVQTPLAVRIAEDALAYLKEPSARRAPPDPRSRCGSVRTATKHAKPPES